MLFDFGRAINVEGSQSVEMFPVSYILLKNLVNIFTIWSLIRWKISDSMLPGLGALSLFDSFMALRTLLSNISGVCRLSSGVGGKELSKHKRYFAIFKLDNRPRIDRFV